MCSAKNDKITTRETPSGIILMILAASLLSFLLALFLFPVNAVTAQTLQKEIRKALGETKPQEGVTETKDVPGQVATIPLSDIGTRAEEAVKRIMEIRSAVLGPDQEVVDIGLELPGALRSIQELREYQKRWSISRTSRRVLIDFRQQWSFYRTKLDAWQGTLANRAQEFENAALQLETMRKTWSATYDEASGKDLPETLADRIRSVLDNVQAVESDIRVRRENLLGLQGVIAAEVATISGVIGDIDEAVLRERRGLFSLDSPPIWRAVIEPREGDVKPVTFGEFWNDKLRTLSIFLENYRRLVVLHLVLFLLLFLLIRGLGRSGTYRVDETKRPFAAPSLMLRRPFSAALLLALLLTLFLYPLASIDLLRMALLLSFIPALLLFPGRMYRPFIVLFILWFISNAFNFSDQTLTTRLILLSISLTAFLYDAWLIRSEKSPVRDATERWSKVFVFFERLWLVIFGIAIIVNIAGNVSLAEHLAKGALSSAYFGIILISNAWVLDDLFTVLLQTPRALKLHAVRNHGELIRSRGTGIIHIAALLFWLIVTLRIFSLFAPVADWLSVLFGKQWTIGKVGVSVGDAVVFIAVLYLSVIVSRFIQFILREDVFLRVELPRGLSATILMLLRYVVWSLGFLFALSAIGVNMDRITIVAGALGVGIGFGLQNIVNNFISGLILAFERPVQIGDVIQVGTLIGKVEKIGIRSSRVRTFEGADVIIPNADLISKEVTNWTLSDQARRIDISVGVSYGTDPERVLTILLGIARSHPDAMKEPEPVALFLGFGDSSLNFQLLFWTAQFDRWLRVRSEVTVKINEALREAGIGIPFPQRDLHLRSVDPSVLEPFGKQESRQAEPKGE